MHRRLVFVFRVWGHVLRDLVRFESVYLTALGINVVVLPVLVELGLQRIPARRRRHSGGDVVHVKWAAVTAEGGDGVELSADSATSFGWTSAGPV
jgi:hypothetical protein